MSTNYPGAIDNFTNPSPSDYEDVLSHAGQHSNANDAIEAIEQVIGTTAGSAFFGSFTANQKPVAQQGGTVPAYTYSGGTYSNPTIQGGTAGTLSLRNTWVASGEYAVGTPGTLGTINWSNGDRQSLTLGTNTTLVYSNAVQGQTLILRAVMGTVGGRTLTLPTSLWVGGIAGSVGTAANSINLFSIYFDGTNYLTQIATSFA